MAIAGSLTGIEADVPCDDRVDAALFGECGERILIAVAAGDTERVRTAAKAVGVRAVPIGRSGGERVVVRAGAARIDLAAKDLRGRWEASLPAIAQGRYE